MLTGLCKRASTLSDTYSALCCGLAARPAAPKTREEQNGGSGGGAGAELAKAWIPSSSSEELEVAAIKVMLE